MKILFLSDNFPPEGNAPATRLYEHAVRWVRAGHEVTVVTGAPNFPEGRVYPGYANRWRSVEDFDGIRVVRVKTYITANEGSVKRTFDYLSFMLSGFTGAMFERRPDIVVATSPQFFCAVAGWAVAALRRLPFVFELRDLWPASITAVGAMRPGPAIRFLEHVEMFLYRRATAIVALTHSFRKELIDRGVDAAKIEVVVNGVDLDQYQPAARKDSQLAAELDLEGRFVAGYLGTHGMAHALGRVLDAAELLRERADIVFLFAGGGADRANVEQQVEARRLTNVRLLPRQPKQMMARLWSVCDVALIPLRDTPVFATVLPSKLFEAMGMGVAVVMSLPDGEATSIVRETGCGVCVPPENSAAMAQAVRELAGSTAILEALRARSAQAARAYSRETQAARMLFVLTNIVDEGNSARR